VLLGLTRSMLDVFAKLQRGEIDLGLLSGAQVDRHGNLNSTVIGEYASPKVRLPGSGGAHDIAMLARDVVILMPHNPERFVKSISFVTSPGHFPARSRTAGLGGGPMALVTDRAIFHFQDGKMTLTGLYGDNSAEHAVEGIPWKIPKAKSIERIDPPSPELSNLVRKFLGENK
jgi:glutaconate CoA-transferase subunit B